MRIKQKKTQEIKQLNRDVQEENRTFRYLYGFAILFVVLSHCDGGGFEMLSNWMHFGAFHLAVFVFGSGYLKKAADAEHPFLFLIKKICKLLIPLWVINAFYGLILFVLQRSGFSFGEPVTLKSFLFYPVSSKNLFVLDMGAWFVFPFFMVQILYIMGESLLHLLKKEKVTDIVWQLLFLAIGILGVFLSCRGVLGENMMVYIRIAYFMPFYILGIWYRRYFEAYANRIPATVIFAVCLVIALLLNGYFGRVVYAIPSSCDYPFGVFATYLSAVIGITFWLTVSRKLAKIDSPIRLLSLLGNHTWDIMFHQFTGILLLKCIFAFLNRLFGIFADFDYMAFYSDIWYLYLPKGLPEMKALYVVAAIAFSILVGKTLAVLKNEMLKLCKPRKGE